MGDKRGSDYVNLGALYGAPRPDTGLSRPDPVRGPVFVSHEAQLRRDLEIVNARTMAEPGPLPAPINHETTEDEVMKLSQAVVAAAVTIGMAACQSEIGAPQQPTPAATLSAAESTISMPALGLEDAQSPNMPCVKTLFYCKTKNDKEVLLCDLGKTLQYSFGKPGIAPELSLSIPREKARTSQWKGIGRWIYYSVTIPNGNTNYSVFTSLDRMSESLDFEAGVSVTVGDKEIARIRCAEPIVHHIEGIDLKGE